LVGEIVMPSRFRLKAALACVVASTVHAAAIVSLLFGQLGYAAAARAAEPPPATATESTGLSSDELLELVGPVALYPDELLAIVLPATTWPLQIVQAARFLEKHAADPTLEPEEDWDPSVIGLLNYPDVVNMMNQDLNWTWRLGEAVTNQQEDIMDSIQIFRAKADAAGNLDSNENVLVTRETDEDEQIIVIESQSTEVIYVPVYQPRTVVVVHSAPYPWHWWGPHPLYFRTTAVFWTGMFVGRPVGWHMRWGRRGHSSIRINRNVNVNVNRPTRPGTPNRPNRPDGGGRGDGIGGGDASGVRDRAGAGAPGGARDRAGAGTRDRAGSGAGGRDRVGAGSGARERGQVGTGARDRTGAGTRDRAGGGSNAGARDRAGSRSGRDMTRGSQRSSAGSSMGRYSSGANARSSGSRGATSRGASRGGGSRGGASRGGGSRGGGGRRR
jgi:hypothetical protein